MNDEPMNESNSAGFMDRVKESPRTVSALIIILIVAAAIYAFSGEPVQPNQQALNDEAPLVNDEAAIDGEVDEEDEATETPTEATPAATAQATAMPVAPAQVLTPTQLQEMNQGLPAAERRDNAYVEVAQAGDGITHLARRATTRWLAESSAGYEISNEHRIYIEDYIQNSLGSDGLAIGQTHTISFEMVAEAVKSAGELNEQQLRNLSRYTTALN